MNGSERRQAFRVTRRFILRYQLPTAASGEWQASPLRDVSTTGARFLSEQRLDPGARLSAVLQLGAARPLPLVARVMWTKPAQAGLIEVGVTFEFSRAADQRLLDDTVSHLLRPDEEERKMMGKDRRRFKRVLAAFTVHCRRLGTLAEVWQEVVAVDLSASGVRLHSPEPYEEEEQVELELEVPGLRSPLMVRGRVVWFRSLPGGGVECSVEFADVGPDKQAAIDEMVQFLSKPPASR
jgi:hypothetical protein